MKKICPSGSSRKTKFDVLGYTYPTYHNVGKNKYVDFYFKDPISGAKTRKKYHFESIVRRKERDLFAAELIVRLLEKLRSGWLPVHDENENRNYTLFNDCVNLYCERIKTASRRKTYFAYSSRIKIFNDFLKVKSLKIQYAYQLTSPLCVSFIDWLRIDRKLNARTVNNYRNWLFSFCDFLIERGFLEKNPVERIHKCKESRKLRRDLSPQMLKELRIHLEKRDKFFLLACMFEYFTFIRPNELRHLKIGDINLKDQKIFVSGEYSKNGKDSFVALNETLIKLMVDLDVFNRPGNYYLFSNGFQPGIKMIYADAFNRRWKITREELKWNENVKFYSLKDSGLRDLANSAGIVVARDQARHSDISTTNKYIQGNGMKVHEETKHFSGNI